MPSRLLLPIAATLLAAACTGTSTTAVESDQARHEHAHDLELVPVPPVPEGDEAANAVGAAEVAAPDLSRETPPAAGAVAVIGEHGHLGSLTDTGVDDRWLKWRARPSLDGTAAVLTLHDELARTIAYTPVSWVSLPDAVDTGDIEIHGVVAELNAVSQSGDLVALTNFADPKRQGEIAGAKMRTTLVIADRDGVRYQQRLEGNFVAEAFGRTVDSDGLPDQVFLLEHIPAEAPQFYRVRVLSTETGELSLPLNIRDKSQQVDERMSGLSRSQVIADEHGLLFTLYRGTIDGAPDGEPYAFVHTLDLANGVWCLFLDPALELETLPGSIAVGGDRLYVASANGKLGVIDIPSISDVDRAPEMDWVVSVGSAGDEPPTLLADDEGVWVGQDDGTRVLQRFGDDGSATGQKVIEGWNPTALAYDSGGDVVAAGDGWSSVGDPMLPDWFGAPRSLFAGSGDLP